jgi:glycosyltransferase involved in cell wall biosynthesis
VCLVFYPDASATSILFTDLFLRLARAGFQVTVLCGFPQMAHSGPSALPRHEYLDGITIVRCGAHVDGKRNLLTRGIHYGSFLLEAGCRLVVMRRSGLVVGSTNPPFTPVIVWLAWLLKRFRYELIVLDVYPDGLVALGAMTNRSPVVRLWRRLNRISFRRAYRLIVIGRDMVALLATRYGVSTGRVTYLPHWATQEIDTAEALRRNAFLAPLGIEDRFVVQYSGNMGLWHDIDALVRAAAQLQDEKHIHFLFIGEGVRRRSAEALSMRLGLSNITWMDFLPRARLIDSLPACDAALISLRSGLEGVAVPSKLYGILAAGRPVIAQVPLDSEVARVVREEACGIVVLPGDVAGLAAAVRRLADNPLACETMGNRARLAYERRYTLDRAVEAFVQLWNPT